MSAYQRGSTEGRAEAARATGVHELPVLGDQPSESPTVTVPIWTPPEPIRPEVTLTEALTDAPRTEALTEAPRTEAAQPDSGTARDDVETPIGPPPVGPPPSELGSDEIGPDEIRSEEIGSDESPAGEAEPAAAETGVQVPAPRASAEPLADGHPEGDGHPGDDGHPENDGHPDSVGHTENDNAGHESNAGPENDERDSDPSMALHGGWPAERRAPDTALGSER